MPGMLFGLNVSTEVRAGTDPAAAASKAEQLGFDTVYVGARSAAAVKARKGVRIVPVDDIASLMRELFGARKNRA